jgi:Zn-finger nucleic acid-binding protein
MKIAFVEKIETDYCESCGGTWLDQGEIAPIVKTVEESFSEKQKIKAFQEKKIDLGKNKNKKCPKCTHSLEQIEYAVNSGVIIDRCPSLHGFFFDKSELENIQILMEEYDARNSKTSKDEDYVSLEIDLKLCPVDKTVLREISYESETLDFCSTCKGIWCDNDELQSIIENRDKIFTKNDFSNIKAVESNAKNVSESEKIKTLSCVVCQEKMDRLNYSYSSGIIVDRCRRGHGIWLDHSEIEQIQVFVERWQVKTNDLKNKYQNILEEAKTRGIESYDKKMDQIKVSHFGVVNRFFRHISKK